MKAKILSVLNLMMVIVLIAWNGYANTGNFNGKTVGDLSAEYNNLFTPASYAFSIWGLIFLMLIIYSVYTMVIVFNAIKPKPVEHAKSQILSKASPWFLIANICCAVWVAFWLEEMIFISVLCMLGILFSLLKCVMLLRIEQHEIPAIDKFLVWFPISLYAGWISVATVANISAWLSSIYNFSIVTQETIFVVVLFVTFLIYAIILLRKNMRVFTLVGIWALLAIAVRHWISDSAVEDFYYLGITAFALASFLGVLLVYKSID